MWWNKPYINRRNWILENMPSLSISSQQALVLLMIDYLNEQGIALSLDLLAERLGMNSSEVDQTIHELVTKHFLTIRVENQNLVFCMDGLFEDGVIYEYVNENIFEVFESEFGRLLSQNELMMLNKWLSVYTEDEILDALRNALVYKKVSMQYINAILTNSAKEKYDSTR